MSTTELIEKKTIGEVEHIVHASGEWDGTGPVEFSDDGIDWVQAWSPTPDATHPEFARVEVYRKGVRIPTTVTIRWSEQYPAASEEWSGKWDRSPMRHFGRTARMVGFRQTFRDLLGNVVIEDEADERATPAAHQAASTAEAAPGRDWASEIAAATTVDELDAVDAAARAVRAFSPDRAGTDLHRTMRARRRELVDAIAPMWDPSPVAAEPTVQVEHGRPARRAPKDHLPPANRAARRKAARKKGGRR
jgi:hypothetical protein